MFAAESVDDVTAMNWRFAGLIADQALAAELGDAKLMQMDLATARDGSTLAFLNPSRHDGRIAREIHQGCRVLELVSLEPPQIRRECGRPVVRASVTTSDLFLTGSGSCGYDAASATGIVVVRRPDVEGDSNS
jgi:hypothetical protein